MRVKIPEKYYTLRPNATDKHIYMAKEDFIRFVVHNSLPIFYCDDGEINEYTLYSNKVIYSMVI